MNTIAERIRFAMNVRNVKQVEMVQKTGITKGAFSSYLSGNYNPKKDKLELIADALDININWLMGENVPMENSSAKDNPATGYVFYKEMEYLLNDTDTAYIGFQTQYIIRLIVLLVAFSVLLYPTFSSYLNEKNGSKVVSYYDEESVKLSKAEKEQMLEDARAYNKEMLGNIDLIDPFSQEDVEIDARYESLLNVDGSGMMGYIRIPKINVELPIYHGTSEAVLQAGVGHFWGTSLPVGGESTHTVLTGHRGLPTKTLFTNMDKLEVGDIFYIKVLDETLAYQIDQILTVLPQETDSLSIEPGKDYATLVTCTPFAINTHRLLVRGERIPYEEATKQEPDTNIKPELSFTAKVLIVTIIVIFIGLMVAIIYSIRDRKRRKVR